MELPIHVHGLTRASCVDTVSFHASALKQDYMTIQDLTTVVIEKLKTIQSKPTKVGHISDYRSFWDEYKEQLQFQIYPNYDIYEDEVRGLACERINELSDKDIKSIFNTICGTYNALQFVPTWEINSDTYYPPASFTDKKNHIINSILTSIQSKATSEKVEYVNPHVQFIKYFDENNTIIAEVIQRLNPWEYKVCSYSRTLAGGKEDIINFPDLKTYNRLIEITEEEFISLKNVLQSGFNEVERLVIKKKLRQLVKLTAKVKNKTPLEVIREMQDELEQRKSKTDN